MCLGCWEKYGSHKTLNDKIKSAVYLINNVYEYSIVGGNLHIVIDDWNIENHSLLFCEKHILEEEDGEQKEAELKCLNALLDMTIEERNSALYWQWEGLERATNG